MTEQATETGQIHFLCEEDTYGFFLLTIDLYLAVYDPFDVFFILGIILFCYVS